MPKESHAEKSSADARPTARTTSSTSHGDRVSPPKENRSIAFHFLNISHPSEAKEKKMRSEIQSHTAHVQHSRGRSKRSKNVPKAEADEEEDEESVSPEGSQSFSPGPSTLTLPHRPVSAAGSLEYIQALAIQVQNQAGPLMAYPEEWRPYIAQLMDYYLRHVVPETPDLDGQNAKNLFRNAFYPFIFTDPALLRSVMLLTASHRGRARDSSTQTVDILQLRGMAIHEINTALEDPDRRLSDQVIVAVAHMAYYEALYDDKEGFKTHMTGVLRLVSLRGGLPALGLNGLLERLLLWIDANAAYITGASVIFDETAFPSKIRHPRPDPSRFSGGLQTSPRP